MLDLANPMAEQQAALAAIEARATRAVESLAKPGLMTRLVDRAIGLVSPSALAHREADRFDAAMSIHKAAAMNRLTADWYAETVSGDQATLDDMATINARARQGRRDNWAITSICSSYRRDIGYMTPRSAAFDPRTGEKLVDLNRRLDWLWRRWSSRAAFCDFHRQNTLAEACGLMTEEWVQVGSSFMVMSVERRGGPVDLVFELLEVEQLASDLYEHQANGNRIKNGVEVTKRGEPVAMWFYRNEHPLEDAVRDVARVPIDQVLVFTRSVRVREVLPASRLAPVLVDARSLDTYLTYEDRAKQIEACISLQAVKDQSAKGPAGRGLGMQSGVTSGTADASVRDARGRKVTTMQSGIIYDNPPGVKLEALNTTRGGSPFETYTGVRERHIAAGADRSPSSLTRRYLASYTAERRGEVEDAKVNEPLQQLQVDAVLRPLREMFVRLAIMQGKVDGLVPREMLRDPDLTAALYEAEWMPPRVRPLDPAKDAASKKIRLDMKLDNHGRILNEEGRDWRDNFDDIEEQREYAAERGIDLAAAAKVNPSEPRPRGASNAPDGTADDDGGGDDDTEGEGRGVLYGETAPAEAGRPGEEVMADA
jgi:lambda family phage portal protein